MAGDPKGAAELAARARSAYEAGKFRDAADLYQRAHDLDADPTLLFNLARCFEALATLDDLRASIRDYQAYLRARPDASDRAAVERRIDVLANQIRVLEEQSKPKPPPPPAPPTILAAPRAHTPIPWIACGVGLGGIAAGAVLGAIAKGERADANRATSGADALDLEAKSAHLATAANVAFVAGAALAVAGAAWGVIDLASSPKGASGVALAAAPSGAWIHGRF